MDDPVVVESPLLVRIGPRALTVGPVSNGIVTLKDDAGIVALPVDVANSLIEKDVAVREARKAADEAEGEREALFNNKLISSGLTGGIAFGVLAPDPLARAGSNRLVVADGTLIPHAIIIPAYFGLSQTTREYCASAYTKQDEDSASRAAAAIAKKKAARFLTTLVAYGVTLTKSSLKTILFKNGSEMAIATLRDEALQRLIVAYVQGGGRDTERREAIETVMAANDWNPTLRGKCGGTAAGAWLGFPVNLTIRSQIPALEQSDTARVYKPVISFGFAIIPNAYFSVLLGLTYGNLWVGETEVAKGVPYAAWAWTAAIGGNLDLFGILTKAGANAAR